MSYTNLVLLCQFNYPYSRYIVYNLHLTYHWMGLYIIKLINSNISSTDHEIRNFIERVHYTRIFDNKKKMHVNHAATKKMFRYPFYCISSCKNRIKRISKAFNHLRQIYILKCFNSPQTKWISASIQLSGKKCEGVAHIKLHSTSRASCNRFRCVNLKAYTYFVLFRI